MLRQGSKFCGPWKNGVPSRHQNGVQATRRFHIFYFISSRQSVDLEAAVRLVKTSVYSQPMYNVFLNAHYWQFLPNSKLAEFLKGNFQPLTIGIIYRKNKQSISTNSLAGFLLTNLVWRKKNVVSNIFTGMCAFDCRFTLTNRLLLGTAINIVNFLTATWPANRSKKHAPLTIHNWKIVWELMEANYCSRYPILRSIGSILYI